MLRYSCVIVFDLYLSNIWLFVSGKSSVGHVLNCEIVCRAVLSTQLFAHTLKLWVLKAEMLSKQVCLGLKETALMAAGGKEVGRLLGEISPQMGNQGGGFVRFLKSVGLRIFIVTLVEVTCLVWMHSQTG